MIETARLILRPWRDADHTPGCLGAGLCPRGGGGEPRLGLANLDVPRIMAITIPANTASWGLMIRLGMSRRPDLDFGHPQFEPGHPLREHITFEIERWTV
jgi:hypothetical protein